VSTDDLHLAAGAVSTLKLHVKWIPGMRVASLRHFAPIGKKMSEAIDEVFGVALPSALQAIPLACDYPKSVSVLAWVRPSETLWLSINDPRFDMLAARIPTTDGHFVDQTDGLCVISVTGERSEAMFARIGLCDSLPDIGQARRGRMADIAVHTVRVSNQETLLVVSREYMEHLINWIRVTALDFGSFQSQ